MLPVDGGEHHFFLLVFNYHLDLPRDGKPVEQIQGLLRRWNEARDQAVEIVRAVAERDRT